MGKIRSLPDNLINLIAAGEVVERPASVVKELVENSIDAGATEITINIADFGKELIEVSDNGEGMDKDDAIKAFEQHATSKIKAEDDLYNILTLGFRGEALASISSVAERVDVETKTKDSNPIKLTIKQTDITDSSSGKSSNGTTISIVNLFKNVPARRKFLKADNTELRYIVTMFNEIALSNINIRFELNHNAKLLYRLPVAKTLKDRIFDIYGDNIVKGLFEEKVVKTESYQINALIAKPEAARKTSPIQFVSMNGRSIYSKAIVAAAQQAYQGFIHKELKPYYFIFIHINPKLVDVNVHPRKLEVRFENQDEIFKDIYRLIKNVLEAETRNRSESSLTNSFETEVLKTTFTPSAPSRSYSVKSSFSRPTSESSKVNDAISFSKFLIDSSPVEETPKEPEFSIRPSQYFNTFIVYENGNELVFIDQHAAAEKILFEKLLFSVDHIKTKPQLIPEIVELKREEKIEVLELKDEFAKAGIILEDFGGNAIQVVEIPEIIKSIDITNYIYEVINNKDDFSRLSLDYTGVNVSKEVYDILALTACHGSIRAGQKLTEGEMIEITKNLRTLKNPQSCPHGRPIMWKMLKSDLEKNFKRII